MQANIVSAHANRRCHVARLAAVRENGAAGALHMRQPQGLEAKDLLRRHLPRGAETNNADATGDACSDARRPGEARRREGPRPMTTELQAQGGGSIRIGKNRSEESAPIPPSPDETAMHRALPAGDLDGASAGEPAHKRSNASSRWVQGPSGQVEVAHKCALNI